ncbi:MAG: class I SAM-dependent methyltransferase [Cytophagales bacterium]|nr:class I SAM-dependent methyltransferase [Cytophagales bacterium]
MKDLFGRALLDYYENKFKPPLLLHNEYGPPEVIPIDRYFIDHNEFSELEVFALQNAVGKVLDIGAASGRHALYLQGLGMDARAMDISNACCQLMHKAGIQKVICKDIYSFSNEEFDTLFMLMNGIGIAGSIEGLKQLLNHLKEVLKPTGQLIIDSSDISYLFSDNEIPIDRYFGELKFHYEYRGRFDEEFGWLYIDQETLYNVALSQGWTCQIIFTDETDAYLARLQRI